MPLQVVLISNECIGSFFVLYPLEHVFLFLLGVAVALKQAMTPEFKAYQMQVLANCKALSNALIEYGYKIVTGEATSQKQM